MKDARHRQCGGAGLFQRQLVPRDLIPRDKGRTPLMQKPVVMTAAEFIEQRAEFPEAGQWSELEAGQVVHLQAPDVDHGTVVLNLSKALAEFAQTTADGYACFDLGLQLRTHPDTVRFPAISYFHHGPRFAESDREVTSAVPALVVEIASTADRRQRQPKRSQDYLSWGVSTVWIVDPRQKSVDIMQPDAPACRMTASEWLTGAAALDGLRIRVSALFEDPPWWSARRG
jgi:Uma2 family endonuclease